MHLTFGHKFWQPWIGLSVCYWYVTTCLLNARFINYYVQYIEKKKQAEDERKKSGVQDPLFAEEKSEEMYFNYISDAYQLWMTEENALAAVDASLQKKFGTFCVFLCFLLTIFFVQQLATKPFKQKLTS